MPEFTASTDVDVDEFYEAMSHSERHEMVKCLVEDYYCLPLREDDVDWPAETELERVLLEIRANALFITDDDLLTLRKFATKGVSG